MSKFFGDKRLHRFLCARIYVDIGVRAGMGGREEGRRVEGVGSTGVVRSIRTSHRSIGAYVPSGESREITVRNTHRPYIDPKKKIFETRGHKSRPSYRRSYQCDAVM